ncbi:outer membrane beta-barrel protein [Parasphingorhabdus sp. DH2-15]|uniref:outer membrane beta-barrel protein n=1 Tax=Parasphingorhabdus sp. DH2-15 TaxID=3444112 RepID=UPI003F688FC0
MKKTIISILAIGVATAASPAMAQSNDAQAEFYVGASAGYHDVGDLPIVGTVDGIILGGYAGVDVPVGETIIIGLEGNYHFGTSDIDSEYGIAAKLGTRVGNNGQVFLRGGYQEVDFDLGNIVGGGVPAGLDDSDGDYLVGVGGQISTGNNIGLRLVVDTIGFDTVRATVGVQYNF